jgi:hypothetical protein
MTATSRRLGIIGTGFVQPMGQLAQVVRECATRTFSKHSVAKGFRPSTSDIFGVHLNQKDCPREWRHVHYSRRTVAMTLSSLQSARIFDGARLLRQIGVQTFPRRSSSKIRIPTRFLFWRARRFAITSCWLLEGTNLLSGRCGSLFLLASLAPDSAVPDHSPLPQVRTLWLSRLPTPTLRPSIVVVLSLQTQVEQVLRRWLAGTSGH